MEVPIYKVYYTPGFFAYLQGHVHHFQIYPVSLLGFQTMPHL